MLKGINKQVVELCDTGNEYFEKAILFVKPEYYGLGEGKLRERAQNIIKNAGNPPKNRTIKSSDTIPAWIKISIAAVSGAAVSATICLLIM